MNILSPHFSPHLIFPLHRDRLVFPRRGWYYATLTVDLLLRFTWSLQLSPHWWFSIGGSEQGDWRDSLWATVVIPWMGCDVGEGRCGRCGVAPQTSEWGYGHTINLWSLVDLLPPVGECFFFRVNDLVLAQPLMFIVSGCATLQIPSGVCLPPVVLFLWVASYRCSSWKPWRPGRLFEVRFPLQRCFCSLLS